MARRKRTRKTKPTVRPYAYGIGPNELAPDAAKRMGLVEYRRIAVDAGSGFDRKVTAKRTDAGWHVTVGCETRSLTDWKKDGQQLIEDNYNMDGPSVLGPRKVDKVDSVCFYFSDGDSEYVAFDDLPVEARDAITAKALEQAGPTTDDDDDYGVSGQRLYATLLAAIKELEALK